MTKDEKQSLVAELSAKLSGTETFYIADTGGMTVAQVNKFRGLCFEGGIEYRVVKNTLIKKALETLEVDYSEFDSILKGSSGIMFAPEAANAPAKAIKAYLKGDKNAEKPALKAASVEGSLYVGPEHLDALSELKSKDELIGEIIGLLQSPAKNVISALKSGGDTIAGLVKTLSEREG